jgi:hypothetical protein
LDASLGPSGAPWREPLRWTLGRESKVVPVQVPKYQYLHDFCLVGVLPFFEMCA